MHKAIQLLEKIGENSHLDIDNYIINNDIELQYIEPLQTADLQALANTLNLKRDIVCMVVPAEDDEENKEQEDETPNTDEKNIAIGF